MSGDTKIVFDPLFRNDFGTYRLVPEDRGERCLPGLPFLQTTFDDGREAFRHIAPHLRDRGWPVA